MCVLKNIKILWVRHHNPSMICISTFCWCVMLIPTTITNIAMFVFLEINFSVSICVMFVYKNIDIDNHMLLFTNINFFKKKKTDSHNCTEILMPVIEVSHKVEHVSIFFSLMPMCVCAKFANILNKCHCFLNRSHSLFMWDGYRCAEISLSCSKYDAC